MASKEVENPLVRVSAGPDKLKDNTLRETRRSGKMVPFDGVDMAGTATTKVRRHTRSLALLDGFFRSSHSTVERPTELHHIVELSTVHDDNAVLRNHIRLLSPAAVQRGGHMCVTLGMRPGVPQGLRRAALAVHSLLRIKHTLPGWYRVME